MDFQVEILDQSVGSCQILINPQDFSQLRGINGSVLITNDGLPVFAFASKTIAKGKLGCDAFTAKLLNLGDTAKISNFTEKPLIKYLDCKIVCKGEMADWNAEIIPYLQKMNVFSVNHSYRIDDLSFFVKPVHDIELDKNTCVVCRESEICFESLLSENIIYKPKPIGCILESSSQCSFANLLKKSGQFEVIDLRDTRLLHSFLDASSSRGAIFTHLEYLSRIQNIEEKISVDNLISTVASLLVSRRSIFLVNSSHEIPAKIQQVIQTKLLTVRELYSSLYPDPGCVDPLNFTADNSRSPKIPLVTWDDIGGQDEVKSLLRESSIWCRKETDKFHKFGLRPPRGILLYGPPGCSKTLLVKALASENSANFFSIRGPEIFCKWVGDSEKKIREIFEKARLNKPSLIFFVLHLFGLTNEHVLG